MISIINIRIILIWVNNNGANRLKDLDVALRPGVLPGEQFLYFSWLSRVGDKNEDIQGPVGGPARTLTTNLCGQDVEVDSRLDVYCLRFF